MTAALHLPRFPSNNVRPRHIRVLALTVLMIAAQPGCRKSEAASPRVAVRAFMQAMVDGNEPAMRDASVGDEPSARLLAAQARQNCAYEKLSATAAKKFGDASKVLAGRRADAHYPHYAERLNQIDTETEAAFDDGTAIVGEGSRKIYLKRVGQLWKVDRERLVPPQIGDPGNLIRLVDGMAAANDEVASGIESGRYATAQEARAALLDKTTAAVLRDNGGAQSRPASQPTSRP